MSIYTAGLRSVGSYQVSGYPFVTGSNGAMADGTQAKVSFPNITKSVTIINSGSSGWRTTGSFHSRARLPHPLTAEPAHHYNTLADVGDSNLNVKCKEIYVTSVGTQGFELFAELTFINTGSMMVLTGSYLTSIDGSP